MSRSCGLLLHVPVDNKPKSVFTKFRLLELCSWLACQILSAGTKTTRGNDVPVTVSRHTHTNIDSDAQVFVLFLDVLASADMEMKTKADQDASHSDDKPKKEPSEVHEC